MSAENNEQKELKKALFKRALGYDYEEKCIEITKDGKQGKVKIVKKHMPPDIKAIEKLLYDERQLKF